ncbi:hypothetical protein ACOI9Y_38110, partial [Mesorhizobium japonicum]
TTWTPCLRWAATTPWQSGSTDAKFIAMKESDPIPQSQITSRCTSSVAGMNYLLKIAGARAEADSVCMSKMGMGSRSRK